MNKPHTILVVGTNLSKDVEALKHQGLNVVHLESASDKYKETPDLAVVYLDSKGLRLCRELHKRSHHTPIIVVAKDNTSLKDKLLAFKCGCIDLISEKKIQEKVAKYLKISDIYSTCDLIASKLG